MREDISALYYFIDNFCKVYEGWEGVRMLPKPGKRNRSCNMALSELLTIMIFYHLSGYKCFKYYYLYEIGQRHRDKFPKALSYTGYRLSVSYQFASCPWRIGINCNLLASAFDDCRTSRK